MDEFDEYPHEHSELTEGQKVALGLLAVVMIAGLFIAPLIIMLTSTA